MEQIYVIFIYESILTLSIIYGMKDFLQRGIDFYFQKKIRSL